MRPWVGRCAWISGGAAGSTREGYREPQTVHGGMSVYHRYCQPGSYTACKISYTRSPSVSLTRATTGSPSRRARLGVLDIPPGRRLSMSFASVISRIAPHTPCACHPRTECFARSEGSAHGRSYKSNFRYAKVTFQKNIHWVGRLALAQDPSLHFVSFEDDSAGDA